MPCAPTVFAGMSQAQLQAALTSAQAALIQLQSGAMGVTFSYSQSTGGKSISRRVTTVAEVTALILQLQQALGIRRRARRPIRFAML